MSPAQRRSLVRRVVACRRISERRALRVLGWSRTSYRYTPQPRPDEDGLTASTPRLAGICGRYGSLVLKEQGVLEVAGFAAGERPFGIHLVPGIAGDHSRAPAPRGLRIRESAAVDPILRGDGAVKAGQFDVYVAVVLEDVPAQTNGGYQPPPQREIYESPAEEKMRLDVAQAMQDIHDGKLKYRGEPT